MTAEIAVMNKSAVALAADSAVTLPLRAGQKIYTTNKLFTLSKYHPVGIMVYGRAELLEVPWETIIKSYREKLGRKKFPRLVEYHDDFIRFLEKGGIFFSEACQQRYFEVTLSVYFNDIKQEINKRVKSVTETKKITQLEIEKIVADVVTTRVDNLAKLDRLPNFSETEEGELTIKYSDNINNVRKSVFGELPLSTDVQNNLRKIAGYFFTRKIFLKEIAGVVIAGFGDREIFPRVKSFEIEGVVHGKAKYTSGKGTEIQENQPGSIIAFAQAEMACTFMEGVDPNYRKCILNGLKALLLEKYPAYICEELAELGEVKQKMIGDKLSKIGEGVLDEFRRQLTHYSEETHITPVTTAVSFLPKDELAVMAETLVNLTSFKKKVSVDAAETVGGPIDVAVISKGDGFVWIKRKHYFEQNLNPCFMAKYFREG
jgi:hypothetical protein